MKATQSAVARYVRDAGEKQQRLIEEVVDKLAPLPPNVHKLTAEDAPELYETVRALATRSKLPMPQLYVRPSMRVNMAALGILPRGIILINVGAILRLPPAALRGGLAHEMGHIKNLDTQRGLFVLLGLIGSCSWAILTMAGFGMRAMPERHYFLPALLGAQMLLLGASLSIAQHVVKRLGHGQEYAADAHAAELVGAEAFVDALVRVHETDGQAVSLNVKRSWLRENLSSHPPLIRRIERLLDAPPIDSLKQD